MSRTVVLRKIVEERMRVQRESERTNVGQQRWRRCRRWLKNARRAFSRFFSCMSSSAVGVIEPTPTSLHNKLTDDKSFHDVSVAADGSCWWKIEETEKVMVVEVQGLEAVSLDDSWAEIIEMAEVSEIESGLEIATIMSELEIEPESATIEFEAAEEVLEQEEEEELSESLVAPQASTWQAVFYDQDALADELEEISAAAREDETDEEQRERLMRCIADLEDDWHDVRRTMHHYAYRFRPSTFRPFPNYHRCDGQLYKPSLPPSCQPTLPARRWCAKSCSCETEPMYRPEMSRVVELPLLEDYLDSIAE